MKWFFEEPGSREARFLLDDTEWVHEVSAPSRIAQEVANACHQRIRRGNLAVEDALMVIRAFAAVPIRLVDTTPLQDIALNLAHEYRLPALHDAQYLALARVRGDTLWTADRKLYAATAPELPFVRWYADQ